MGGLDFCDGSRSACFRRHAQDVFEHRERLEQLQLGIPLAIELIEQLKTKMRQYCGENYGEMIPDFKQLQNEVLSDRRSSLSSIKGSEKLP